MRPSGSGSLAEPSQLVLHPGSGPLLHPCSGPLLHPGSGRLLCDSGPELWNGCFDRLLRPGHPHSLDRSSQQQLLLDPGQHHLRNSGQQRLRLQLGGNCRSG
jgi:hypothetical protein